MSNDNNSYSSSNPLSKEAELKAFESSFFPAGGSAKLANIPKPPPAPKNLNNVRSKPIHLKTRNWGGKLENGYACVNRSLYDRPNVFYWDAQPVMSERSHILPSSDNNHNKSHSSSSSSSNIPQAPRLPQWNKHRSDNHLIKGKRLRIRNWGKPTKDGWSGMNRELYHRENGLILERNVIINELWAKFQPKYNNEMDRGIEQQQFIQQPLVQQQFIQQPIVQQQFMQQPVKTSLISAVTTTQVIPLQGNTVPMLNPPINDGRVYTKLYNQNAGLASGNRSIGKSRGAPLGTIPLATNSLSQTPLLNTGSMLAPGGSSLPATRPLVNRVPSKKELKAQQKMLKKQNRRDSKLIKKGIIPPSTLSTPSFVSVAPSAPLPPVTPLPPLSNGFSSMDRGLTGGISPTSTGIIGPVATTMVGGSPAMIPTNSFVKQEFINVPNMSMVGSPMM